ncbi:MAG TPA: long-chain fatty acid--CoA ligase [Polyangiales bacterium]
MGDRHFSSWPPRVPREVTLPETSLWYNLEVSAARYPHKACTIFYDSVLPYAELKRQAEHLAGYLQQVCGVQRGDRVALFMHNSPQYVVAYYAILRADAMVVPINPMHVASELAYLLEDSGARVLIGAQSLYAQVAPCALQHVILASYSDALSTETELAIPDFVRAPRRAIAGTVAMCDAIDSALEPRPALAGPSDRCVMPYTSGTTGRPKGCVHTHRSMMHTTLTYAQWYRTFADETLLSVLPLFHVTGMQNSMNGPIYAGATMVIMPRWDRAVAAALIERYRVTSWSSISTMVVDLLSSPDVETYDLSSLRATGGGGAAMPEAIAQKLERLFHLTYVEGYGLTETAAPTHINPAHKPKKQCLGIPIFGVDSRVVDPETLRELPPGEVGEIITHGPQLFAGYWNRPDADAEAFVTLDGKRFLRTGDLGRTDEDGYFFLVDRIKRMINAAGFKVWPAEVEAQLYAHPAIQEVAVIAQRDARRGEAVKAVVVRKPGGALTEEALIAWARTQMAAYKVPRSVEFVSELPKTASGKVLWRALQEREDAR